MPATLNRAIKVVAIVTRLKRPLGLGRARQDLTPRMTALEHLHRIRYIGRVACGALTRVQAKTSCVIGMQTIGVVVNFTRWTGLWLGLCVLLLSIAILRCCCVASVSFASPALDCGFVDDQRIAS